jgi:hypothetical protein
MDTSIRGYNLEIMQKDLIVGVAREHNVDMSLLTDEVLEQVNIYMNKVIANAKAFEKTEDQLGYMVSSLILAALAALEPKIISGE